MVNHGDHVWTREWIETSPASAHLEWMSRMSSECTVVHSSPWAVLSIPPKATDTVLRSKYYHLVNKRLLNLNSDWDGEGAEPITRGTIESVADFLDKLDVYVESAYGVEIPQPEISPLPNGSVDLHWTTPSYELLLNLPSEGNGLVDIYGDDFGQNRVQFKLPMDFDKIKAITWLMARE